MGMSYGGFGRTLVAANSPFDVEVPGRRHLRSATVVSAGADVVCALLC